MSNLNQFTAVIKLDLLEMTSGIDDNATTSGSATVISAISAANHKINLETSKNSPNTTLYTKMPSGTVFGQQCYVVVYNQLYGNHTINLLNTDDASLGTGQTNTTWHLHWIGTKWLEIVQVNG